MEAHVMLDAEEGTSGLHVALSDFIKNTTKRDLAKWNIGGRGA